MKLHLMSQLTSPLSGVLLWAAKPYKQEQWCEYNPSRFYFTLKKAFLPHMAWSPGPFCLVSMSQFIIYYFSSHGLKLLTNIRYVHQPKRLGTKQITSGLNRTDQCPVCQGATHQHLLLSSLHGHLHHALAKEVSVYQYGYLAG